jgi:hypothetical protein
MIRVDAPRPGQARTGKITQPFNPTNVLWLQAQSRLHSKMRGKTSAPRHRGPYSLNPRVSQVPNDASTRACPYLMCDRNPNPLRVIDVLNDVSTRPSPYLVRDGCQL